MDEDLNRIIKDNGLENTVIKRGRMNLHPLREGMQVKPEYVADLESALNGNSVKGFLGIKSGDTVILSNTNGAIEKAFDPDLLPNQIDIFEDTGKTSETSAVQPNEDSGKKVDPFDPYREQQNDRKKLEDALLRNAPVDEVRQLIREGAYAQDLAQRYTPIQVDRLYVDPLAEHYEDMQFEQRHETSDASQYLEENPEVSPKRTYEFFSDLCVNDSMFPGTEYSMLYEDAIENLDTGKEHDTNAILGAFRKPEAPEAVEKALSVSPYVQVQVDAGVPFEQLQESYIKPLVDEYSRFYQERIEKGSSEAQLMSAIEKAGNPLSANESPVISSQIEPPSFELADALRKVQDKSTSSTADVLRGRVETGAEAFKKTANAAIDTFENAQKNLSTFAENVKQDGLKEWALKQLPIVQNKASRFMQRQYQNAQEYVKNQTPKTVEFIDKGMEKFYEKVADYTQLVDPAKIEQLGDRVLGKDGGFEGKTFDFKRGANGVEISLKNGTTVFSGGKLAPNVEGSIVWKLDDLAQKAQQSKSVSETQSPQRKKAFSR
ncbi:MAG: hypothetical protein HC852_22620 [Acaryochloridaceae cyanobacterium RU_4_10]|nr:hypothetical protein [Acaryochloridaceae cyanobacterium RU_4_10]